MHKAARLAVCTMVALGLGACSSFEIPTKKIDYKSSTKLPPLEVPPDLTRPGPDDRFAVPETADRGSASFSAYSRERANRVQQGEASVLPATDNVRVERAGTQRWLVVKGAPEQVWPTVKGFWQEVGFVVNVERPEAGVMETDWNENRANLPLSGIRGALGRALDTLYSSSERDKFRTRLEPGQQPGTTEIYISHRGMEEVYTTSAREDTKWQPRKPDPELEAEMLRRLMVRFGVEQEAAKQRFAAARDVPQAALGAGGGSTLAVNEQFDRAWRRVGLALDRIGFTVEDRDRANGLYFVRYIDPETDKKDDRSWLGRMKFWGKSDTAKNERYRIQVRETPSGAEVSVLNKEGRSDQSDTAKRILTLLYEQLR